MVMRNPMQMISLTRALPTTISSSAWKVHPSGCTSPLPRTQGDRILRLPDPALVRAENRATATARAT